MSSSTAPGFATGRRLAQAARCWHACGLFALLAGLANVAQAQGWPAADRPVTLVVGNAAGGGTDVMARIVAECLQALLKTAVVVDNKPGASGTLAASHVARSPADGQTLLVTPLTLVTTPHVLPPSGKASVDVLADLAPVVQLTEGTLLMVTNPSSGQRDAKALRNRARVQPHIGYGTPGSGSPMHVAGELFNRSAGTRLTHVPYKGVAPALSDLLGNHVSVVFADLASASPHLQSGKLVAIGVTQAGRSPLLPDVPTLTEQGIPGVELRTWFGLFAPAATPRKTLQQINDAVNRVISTPQVQERFRGLGEIPVGGTPQAFAERVKADYVHFQRIVRELGVRAE